MNCAQCKDNLVAYLEELLPDSQKQALESHLAACPPCREQMEQLENLRDRLNVNGKAVGQCSVEATVIDRILQQQSLKLKRTESQYKQFNFWRIIMKSKITKLAAAAVIIVAAIFSINIIDMSVPTAFGIEQVIAAYDSIRFLHVKQFKANQEEPLEFWIKSDEQGRIANARYYLPEHVSPEDGAKLVTWTPEKAELWFKRKNGYLIFQTKRIEGWMQDLVEQSQPKLVMKRLLEDQEAGKVDVDIQEPQEKQKPITITATYVTSPKKEIYYVNQATDLITCIEYYRIENDQEVLESTKEFYDYNVPIDEDMFSLEDEVPEDVTVVDQLNQLIGIPQGDMTDEQAAVETVRQFFQALIDKDYGKAGVIFSGVSEEKAKEYVGHLNVTSIISVGPPTPYPRCGPHSFSVPCEAELITAEGQRIIRKFGSVKARCGDDEMHPDRWIIHGGI
jgi:hypothetical protein